MAVVAPNVAALKSVVGGLFDKGLTISETPITPWSRHDPMTIAVYASDQGNPQAIMMCGIGLAAHAAAALVLLPVSKSQACADGEYIDDELLENFHEVANVSSAMFSSNNGTHVALRELVAPPTEIPKDIRAMLVAPSSRLCAEMSIEGYGSGKILLHCA